MNRIVELNQNEMDYVSGGGNLKIACQYIGLTTATIVGSMYVGVVAAWDRTHLSPGLKIAGFAAAGNLVGSMVGDGLEYAFGLNETQKKK